MPISIKDSGKGGESKKAKAFLDAKTRKQMDIKFGAPPGQVPAAETVTPDSNNSGKM